MSWIVNWWVLNCIVCFTLIFYRICLLFITEMCIMCGMCVLFILNHICILLRIELSYSVFFSLVLNVVLICLLFIIELCFMCFIQDLNPICFSFTSELCSFYFLRMLNPILFSVQYWTVLHVIICYIYVLKTGVLTTELVTPMEINYPPAVASTQGLL